MQMRKTNREKGNSKLQMKKKIPVNPNLSLSGDEATVSYHLVITHILTE